MKCFFRWVMLFLVLLLAVPPFAPALAQEGLTLYRDPQGRFNAYLPEDWTDESEGDIGHFVGPDEVTAFLAAVQSDDADAGVQAALDVLMPALSGVNPIQTRPIPLSSGLWTQRVYLEAGGLVLLFTQWLDGLTYAVLFQAADEATLVANSEGLDTLLVSYTLGVTYDGETQTFTEDMLAELETFVEAQRAVFDVPGAALVIVQGDEIAYAGGFGTLAVDGDDPVTSETLFMIGSTTKSMTTLMLATLVDEGILDWDQPVTDILPTFALSDPEVTPLICVRDLVNNSSGLPRYDFPLVIEHMTPENVFAELPLIPMVAQPGEQYGYSNLMVAAGGYIGALAAGADLDSAYETYVDLMQERVFDPIGMDATTLDFDAALANPNHALPYALDIDTGELEVVPIDFERFVLSSAPAGAVWSNAEDMGRYLIMQLNRGVSPDGERMVSEENLAITQTTEVEIFGSLMGYSMGWIEQYSRGVRLVWHNGGTVGFSTQMIFVPEADLAFAIMANRGSGDQFNLSIQDFVFDLVFGGEPITAAVHAQIEADMLQQMQEATDGTSDELIDVEAIAPYLGEYDRGVTVEMRGDELWLATEILEARFLPVADGDEEMFVGEGIFEAIGLRFHENEDGIQVEIFEISPFSDGLPLFIDKIE